HLSPTPSLFPYPTLFRSSFVSGAPAGISFTTTNGADIAGGGDGVRPVVISNPILSKDQRSFYRFFNTSAFAMPGAGTFGNAPREDRKSTRLNSSHVATSY